jgi:V8-like Glu-specific endopeptidase
MPNVITFPDEISIETIKESKFDAISYQTVRRNGRGETPHHSTSFFINRNFLLTSGHNVTKLFWGSNKPNKLSIYPSRIGNVHHRSSIIYDINYFANIRLAPGYRFVRWWTRIPNDMALIYVPESIISQNADLSDIPFISIIEDISSLEIGEAVYCAGYPAADKYSDQFIMTLDESIISQISNSSFRHQLETKPGNSGSPIMVKRNGLFYSIGVNSIRHNGTLISNQKKEWIQKCIEEMSG